MVLTGSEITNYLLVAIVGACLGAVALRFLWKPKDIAASNEKIKDLQTRLASEEAKTQKLTEENTSYQAKSAALEARALVERESFERERTNIEADTKRLQDAFRSIGATVLQEAIQSQEARAQEMLEYREQTIKNMVSPVAESISAIRDQIGRVEVDRRGAYDGLTARVEGLGKAEIALHERITDLAGAASGLTQALRSSSARGNWGEFHLRRVVEMGGMLAHCDFEEQKSIDSEDGLQRPDMVVHLAQEQHVFIDAKTPLIAFLDAVEATDERTRTEQLKKHASVVRGHVRALSARGYGKKDPRAPEMVIMYIPSEGALSAALAEDPRIIEDALEMNVIIAGPIQLIIILRMFATGWRQQNFEANAQKVVELAGELYERIGKIGEYMRGLHRSVENVVKSYNGLAGSLEARMLPTARKLEALGAVRGGGEQQELLQITEGPRILAAPELTGDSLFS